MAGLNTKMGDQVVIITGANNGIGFHMAVCLLKQQYRVAVFDLSGENLASVQDIDPDKLLFCRCDVTSDSDVKASTEAVVNKWGSIDVL